MRTSVRCWGGPELLILVGACVFIFILALSAYFEPDIRWLHFFQGWMYVAAVALSLRGNRWGYFIGISAAGFWDYMNLFVTTFFRNGLHWLGASLAEGRIQHVDQIIAVPAWIANVLVVVGCLWAFARLPEKSPRDLPRLVLAFVMTTAFFAADVAIFQPRYLPLFRRSLHPHSPLAVASARKIVRLGTRYKGSFVLGMSFLSVLTDYYEHNESKSLAPDGSKSGPDTAGLLRRYPVEAITPFHLMGKEVERKASDGPDISMFAEPRKYAPYRGKVVATRTIRTELAKIPLRQQMRDTGLSHHTLLLIQRGEAVKRKTLQKVSAYLQSQKSKQNNG